LGIVPTKKALKIRALHLESFPKGSKPHVPFFSILHPKKDLIRSMKIRALILTIGDEILLGQIHDTNATWLSEQLSLAGVDVTQRWTVGDTPEDILFAFATAFVKADLLVITGGLGPTRDDKTKELLAEWFHAPLEWHPEALRDLEEKMQRRGRPLNDLVRTQALHPRGADLLYNKAGTAPGIWFDRPEGIAMALPGVPYEMKQMFTDEVLPRIRKRFQTDAILHRFLRTVAVPETTLALRVQEEEDRLPPHIRLAYLPSGGQVKLRLTARGQDPEALARELEEVEARFFACISDVVYAREDLELDAVVADLARQAGLPLLLNDRLSAGRFRLLLFQHPDLAETQEPVSDCIVLNMVPEASGTAQPEQYVGIQVVRGGQEVYTDGLRFRAFPVGEVNRNMVALRALDLLRRYFLAQPKNEGPNTA
jgi:nicotinamide-nucleotide amidase